MLGWLNFRSFSVGACRYTGGNATKRHGQQALQNHQPPVKREDSPYLHQSECGLWITESICNMSHSRDMTAGSFAGDWRRLKVPCWFPRVSGDTFTREGHFNSSVLVLVVFSCLFISCLPLSWGIPIDAYWVWRARVSIDYKTIRYLRASWENRLVTDHQKTQHSTTTFFLPCSTFK